jgi:hypothetical protein
MMRQRSLAVKNYSCETLFESSEQTHTSLPYCDYGAVARLFSWAIGGPGAVAIPRQASASLGGQLPPNSPR